MIAHATRRAGGAGDPAVAPPARRDAHLSPWVGLRIVDRPAGWPLRRVGAEAGRLVLLADIGSGRQESAAHALRGCGFSRGDAAAGGLRAGTSNHPAGDR